MRDPERKTHIERTPVAAIEAARMAGEKEDLEG